MEFCFYVVMLLLNIVFCTQSFVNLVANHYGFDLLHNVQLFMSFAYTMRGVGSMAMIICTVCTVSKIDIMATSVPLFSLVNATGISNCSKDIVEESCVVHQADVSLIKNQLLLAQLVCI